jgi:hypothetical protein
MSAMTDLPGGQAFNITPSDDPDAPLDPANPSVGYTRGVYIGAGGDLRVIMNGNGATITFIAAAEGSLLPISIKQVLATGTTAGGLVAIR